MSMRDHRISVAAGAIEKIVHNNATSARLKTTTAPIPVVRIQYEGTTNQSGSARFFDMIKGDQYDAPQGSKFTEIEIDNTNGALDIDIVFTIGNGNFSQTEISGAVAVAGGTLDQIVNPVEVFPSAEPAGCFPVRNCDDPANPGTPLPVVVQDIGATGGATTYARVQAGTLGAGGGFEIPANPNRKMLYITNDATSGAALMVTESGAGFQTGPRVQPGQTFELCVTGGVRLTSSGGVGTNVQFTTHEVTS